MPSLPPGTRLLAGAYRLDRVLGQGGFAITYLGEDLGLSRPVAVKEHFPAGSLRVGEAVHPGDGDRSEYARSLERFQREARCLATLDHPGIPRVYAVFEQNNTVYTVMEFVEGQTLLERLQRGPVGEVEALDWIEQLLATLRVVHQRGLLHRDVKPDNLILTPEGRIKLLDFGAARTLEGRATAIVSPFYSPPEQFSPSAVAGPESDLFAVAATLYHLLAGRPALEVTERIGGRALVELGELRSGLGSGTLKAVQAGLQLDRGARPGDADQFLALLRSGAEAATAHTGHRGWVRAVRYGPDGRLASASEDKTCGIWEGNRQVASLDHPAWVMDVAWLGSSLVTACSDGRLRRWDGAERPDTWTAPRPITALAGDPGAELVWVGLADGTVRAIRVAGLEPQGRVELGPGAVSSLTVSPDGRWLAAAAGEDRVFLVEVAAVRVVERLKGHQALVRAVAFGRESLYSGGVDRTIRSWDIDHGAGQVVGKQGGTVWTLACRDGLLVSGGGDKQVLAWQAGQSRRLGSHEGEVSGVDISPDGRWVASGGQDGRVCFWPLSGES